MNCINRIFNCLINKKDAIKLGRWNIKTCEINETVSVFWNNSDHCGDVLCGDVKKNKQLLDDKLSNIKKESKYK